MKTQGEIKKLEYLKRYLLLDEKINEMQAESDEYYYSASGKSPKISDMPKGGAGDDGVQTSVEKKIELDQKINAEVDELVRIRRQVYTSIMTVSGKQRRVLYMRHVKGYSWTEIAGKIGCSYKSNNAKKVHKKAIQNVVIPLDGPP